MILYKPFNKVFRNRLEAKLALGSGKYNSLIKYAPDDFIITDNTTTLATYEYFYTNPIINTKSESQK